MSKVFLITGGAGFIGSAVIRHIINYSSDTVINVDKLTYAGNLDSLKSIESSTRYHFEKIDICDTKKIKHVFDKYSPDIVMHLAAESHVDNSIKNPFLFAQTNIQGTLNLLEATRQNWKNSKKQKCFYHISTDEVFGSLGNTGFFTEESSYKPNSPYAASKASSDHLVRAWNKTYGIKTLTSNCCNNYGQGQFPEKLIPTLIYNCLNNKYLPIYGKGINSREWIHVDDHSQIIIKLKKLQKNMMN